MEGRSSARAATGSYRSMLRELDRQNGPFALFQAGEAARRIGDPAKAELYFQRSLRQARNECDKSSMAKALWGLATLRRLSGRISAAIATYRACTACAAEAGSAECLAWARAGLAEITRHSGHHQVAVKQHIELLGAFRSNDDSVGELWALQGIGQIHLVNHSTTAADQFFRRAEDCAHRIGDLRALAFSQRALAVVARRRGDLALARSFLAESRSVFESLEYEAGIGFSLQELAHCEIVEGNFDEAGRLVGESLKRFGDRFPLGRAWTLTTQAQIEKETGGPSQDTLAQSARIFTALGVVNVNLSRPQVRYSRRYFPVTPCLAQS